MEYAKITNGVIENIILADAEFIATMPGDWLDASDKGWGIGWATADGGLTFTAPDVDAPPAPRTLTKLQFLRLLTQEERIAIRAAAKVSPVVEDFMALLDLADHIDKDDDDVIVGLAALTMGGLLAAGRAEEILA